MNHDKIISESEVFSYYWLLTCYHSGAFTSCKIETVNMSDKNLTSSMEQICFNMSFFYLYFPILFISSLWIPPQCLHKDSSSVPMDWKRKYQVWCTCCCLRGCLLWCLVCYRRCGSRHLPQLHALSFLHQVFLLRCKLNFIASVNRITSRVSLSCLTFVVLCVSLRRWRGPLFPRSSWLE